MAKFVHVQRRDSLLPLERLCRRRHFGKNRKLSEGRQLVQLSPIVLPLLMRKWERGTNKWIQMDIKWKTFTLRSDSLRRRTLFELEREPRAALDSRPVLSESSIESSYIRWKHPLEAHFYQREPIQEESLDNESERENENQRQNLN